MIPIPWLLITIELIPDCIVTFTVFETQLSKQTFSQLNLAIPTDNLNDN